jgi:hypothetical protein
MTNVVIYNRVARKEDDDLSRSEQLARILANVEACGWVNVAVYVEDAQGDAA